MNKVVGILTAARCAELQDAINRVVVRWYEGEDILPMSFAVVFISNDHTDFGILTTLPPKLTAMAFDMAAEGIRDRTHTDWVERPGRAQL